MQKYSEAILKEIPIFNYDSSLVIESLSSFLRTTDYIKDFKDQDIIKLGVSREMPPSDEHWIFVRAASIIRALCLQTMQDKWTSIRFFTKKYNKRQNRGCRPSKFARGGAANIKHIIECLIAIEWVMENEGKYRMTDKGLETMKNFLSTMMN